MSLILDIGQGAGLAGASGVRPFLPPLVAGALARGDLGVDFEGTGYEFLEKPPFLLAVLALAVGAYAIDRRRAGREPREGTGLLRDPAQAALLAIALVLGALLFAGSLEDGGRQGLPGLLAGVACAGVAYLAVTRLLSGARRRLEGSAGSLLVVYADAVALALAGLSILLPPVGFLALAAFAFLLVNSRRGVARKYEGLRILR